MTHDASQRTLAESELNLDQPSGPDIDLTRLYRLWEASNWSATSIDLSADARDWHERLTPTQRRAARWNYALFLHGEEAVTRTLAPFAIAAPTHEQRLFLSTQIADEARHHVFFSRFMREVAGDGHDLATTLEAARPDLTRGFRQVFGELDRLADKLRRHPRDLALYAQCIALYHLIVEGTLAHPGQHFIQTYLAAENLLPGFSAGMERIARDEARHMAFGLQVLKELIASSARIRQAVVNLLERLLPLTLTVFAPPNLDQEYVRAFGFEMQDIYSFGLRSLQAKLQRIGIAPGELVALVQLGSGEPPEELARRALVLLHAGILGDAAPLHVSEEALALIFGGLARILNMRGATALPGAIQWSFTDAAPWRVQPEQGQAVARPGAAAAPLLVFRSSVEDWARIAGHKMDARWAVLTRRLKIEGDLKLALRMPGLLGG